jgi:signal transduction histidine kinase
MTAIRSRYLGLGLSCVLFLSSYLAVRRITPDWDVSGQGLFLLAFLIPSGQVVIIRELAQAHAAKEVANAKLAEAHARLQEYSAQVEELSTVRERNRIAREIHDTLGHSLTLLSVQLETATQLEARGDSRLHEKLLEARRVAKACLTDVRHSVEALRPDEASSGSLPEQLQQLVKEFEATCHETSITLDIEEAIPHLNAEQGQALYRCAQEALTNIRKHAHATKVLLRFCASGVQDGMVELTVLDNGQGRFPQDEQHTSGFGLVGMRERLTSLDGTLRAGPERGHGWRVEVVLPLKPCKPVDATARRMGRSREKISSW